MPAIATHTEAFMADELTGTQDGSDPGVGAAAPTATASGTPDAGTPTRTYTDADLAAARRKAESEARAAKDALAEVQARLDALEAEKLTEAERVQKQRDDALARVQALEAEAAQAKRDAQRANVIALHAADLPLQFRTAIQGESEEELVASIAEQRAAFDALKASILGSAPQEPPKPQTTPIGAPSNASAAQPEPPQPNADPYSRESWLETRKRMGVAKFGGTPIIG